MIHLRLREWGEAEWTSIFFAGELEDEVLQIIGSALATSPLHVQLLNEENEWEDL